MFSVPFPNKLRNGVAALTSLLALFAVLFYIAGPSSAKTPGVSASYAQASAPVIEGALKTHSGAIDRHGRVVLVFVGIWHHIMYSETVNVGRSGRFRVAVPKGARSVWLTAVEGPGRRSPRVSKAYTIVPGKTMALSVVFQTPGTGFLPGVFPY